MLPQEFKVAGIVDLRFPAIIKLIYEPTVCIFAFLTSPRFQSTNREKINQGDGIFPKFK
jgi:hypothetical protein